MVSIADSFSGFAIARPLVRRPAKYIDMSEVMSEGELATPDDREIAFTVLYDILKSDLSQTQRIASLGSFDVMRDRAMASIGHYRVMESRVCGSDYGAHLKLL